MNAWDAYRGKTEDRLLLPLRRYIFDVDFVDLTLTPEQVASLSQQLTSGIIEAIRQSPSPNLGAISFPAPTGDMLFILHYGAPVYDFSVEFSRRSIAIGKRNCTLEDYVLSLPLLEEVAQQLFGANTRFSLAQHDFFRWVHRVSHQFDQEIDLGTHRLDEKKSRTNKEIMGEFLELSEGSALGSLQPEAVLRADVDWSYVKTLDGRAANLWVQVKAPWTPTERDMSFDFSFRRGERGSPVDTKDFFEFRVVAETFYRDTVVERLYRRLFRDTNVTGRLG